MRMKSTTEMEQRVAAGSLLSVEELEIKDVASILKLADVLEDEKHTKRGRRLEGRKVALLFYESSTRTRTSF